MITYLRSFEYKVLHSILFSNKKLYLFGITKSPLCSYCNTHGETPIHLFCGCDSTKCLWLQLNKYCHFDLKFPVWTPQTAVPGLVNDTVSNICLINHILSLFIIFTSTRNKHQLNINDLLANIFEIKKLEKVTTYGNVKMVAAYNRKWNITNRKLWLWNNVRFATCVWSSNERNGTVSLVLKTLKLSSRNHNIYIYTFFYSLLTFLDTAFFYYLVDNFFSFFIISH